MKGWTSLIALGGGIGLGLMFLSDRPPPPVQGIVVVPGAASHAGSVMSRETAAATSVGLGVDLDGQKWRQVAAVVPERSIWDDGGAPDTWAPSGPPAAGQSPDLFVLDRNRFDASGG